MVDFAESFVRNVKSRFSRAMIWRPSGNGLTRESLATREKSLWRYREVLPLPLEAEPVTFGEGWTPLLPGARFGAKLGLANLWVKDEAQNPTQSFKARGMAVAVSMAKHSGDEAGGADGGECRRRRRRTRRGPGRCAHLHAARHAARQCDRMRETGAHVTLVEGLITDCGAEIARRKRRRAGSTCRP